MEPTKTREYWADMLKLLASFLVILGHALENDIIEGCQFVDFQNSLCLYIYSFHMPLFMILAGYFSGSIIRGKIDITKRFRQLIIPCILLAIFPMIYGWHMPMWFLKSLFLCYAITALSVKYLMRKHFLWVGIILCTLFILLAPVISITPIIFVGKLDFMLPFFVLGVLLNNKKEWLFNRWSLIISGILAIICLYLWNTDYVWYHSSANYFSVVKALRDDNYSFDAYNLWCCTIRFITGASISIFLMSALKMADGNPPSRTGWHILEDTQSSTSLSTLGKYSMHIYILQTFFVEQNILGIHYISCSPMIYTYVLIPLISIGMFILCIITAILLERITIVNALLFGNKESQNKLFRH